jgi:hypothetical protein
VVSVLHHFTSLRSLALRGPYLEEDALRLALLGPLLVALAQLPVLQRLELAYPGPGEASVHCAIVLFKSNSAVQCNLGSFDHIVLCAVMSWPGAGQLQPQCRSTAVRQSGQFKWYSSPV